MLERFFRRGQEANRNGFAEDMKKVWPYVHLRMQMLGTPEADPTHLEWALVQSGKLPSFLADGVEQRNGYHPILNATTQEPPPFSPRAQRVVKIAEEHAYGRKPTWFNLYTGIKVEAKTQEAKLSTD